MRGPGDSALPRVPLPDLQHKGSLAINDVAHGRQFMVV